MATDRRPRPTRTDWQSVIPQISDDWYKAYGNQTQQDTSQEEPGFVDKLWGSAKAVGEGLTFFPSGVVDTLQDAVLGFDPSDKEEMAQRAQRESELQAYQQKYAGQAWEGVTDAMSSAPYGLATMGAGLLGGVGGGFVGGPVGAGVGSMAASGTTAYRASVPEFERTMYGVTTDALGREPSPEEWTRVRDNFAGEATKYGLWEAGPEAVSNLLMVKILGPLGSKFKGGVKDVIKRVAGLYGEELATETITQMGQGAIQADIGLRENAPGVVDAFNEVAPATFWQTTLMAGGKKGLDLAFRRANQGKSENTQLPPEDAVSPEAPAEARGVGGVLALPSSVEASVSEPAIEPDEILYDDAFINGAVVSPAGSAPIDLLALSASANPERQALPQSSFAPAYGMAGVFALPEGTGAIPMQGAPTGLGPIAPPTDFSTPIPQPAGQRQLALPQQPMAGVNPGLWSGGRSQLAYGPKSASPAMPVQTGPKPAPAMPTPAPIPAAQQILNMQPTPRADTTAQAQALGIPAPDPMPAASALGAGTPVVPTMPNALHGSSMPTMQSATPMSQAVQSAVAQVPQNMPPAKSLTRPQLMAALPPELKAKGLRLGNQKLRAMYEAVQAQQAAAETAPVDVPTGTHSAYTPETTGSAVQTEGVAPFSSPISEETSHEGRGKVRDAGGNGGQGSDYENRFFEGERRGHSGAVQGNGDGRGRSGSLEQSSPEKRAGRSPDRQVALKIPNRSDEPAHYELLEADEVQASHLPHAAFQRNPAYALENERRYHDESGSQAKVLENAARLDPAFLLDSVDANHGAPVVDKDNNVLGGNGRAMSIVKAYDAHPERSKAYREALKTHAERLGIDAQDVDAMRVPMLVRRLDRTLSSEERQQLVSALNDDFKDSKEKRAAGKSRGDRFSPQTLAMLASGLREADSLRQFFDTPQSVAVVEKLLDDGVLQRSERNALLSADGLLNPDGKKIVEEALRGRIARSYEALGKLSADVVAKLDAAIPHILVVEHIGKPWHITEHVRDSVDMLVAFTASGTKDHAVFLKQVNMLTGKAPVQEYSKQAVALFRLALTAKKAEYVKAFARYAANAGMSVEAGGLQGIAKPQNEMFRDAFGMEEDAQTTGTTPVPVSKPEPESAEDTPPPRPEAIKQKVAQEASDASTPVARHARTVKNLRKGTANLAGYQKAFADVLNGEKVFKADLFSRTKDELFAMGGRMFAERMKSEKKSVIVDRLYSHALDEYALGNHYGPTSYMMGEHEEHSRQKREALVKLVANQTQSGLDTYAAEVAEAMTEVAAKREAATSAVKYPKTLDDYRRYIYHHMDQGKTPHEARMLLSPEQRAGFDRELAQKSRSSRKDQAQSQQSAVRAAGQVTGGQIIATKHTQKGHDLFAVRLEERVSREDYQTLLASAKKLGGYYSQFRGNGAVPGFQFTEKINAEAFLKLAQGDTAEAQAVAEERRDAYEDDRSQTAVERLEEMAIRMESEADEVLNATRKVNTARRAHMAASVEGTAEQKKAMAKTMRRIAAAIEEGTAVFLDRTRQKVQVDYLATALKLAKYAESRAIYPTYGEQLQHEADKPTVATADYAAFPRYRLFRSTWATLGRKLLEREGFKSLGKKILSQADDVTDTYLDFAREHLQEVSRFKTNKGDAVFSSRELAETAITRSGYKGKAIVLPVKRGQNHIILSPTAAREAGIWDGDDDRAIALSADFVEELLSKTYQTDRDIPQQLWDTRRRLALLSRMGLETPEEFRSALREYMDLETPVAENKARELELKLSGRRTNDGLDFFPTPAPVVDRMLSIARIEPGMRVLEPSAGMGHIADKIRVMGVEPEVVEASGDRQELLKAKGYELAGNDFLAIASTEDGYDRIVMNPPFSKRQDTAHVRHAYELLNPGGRLVAVMSEGSFFGSDKKATEFRQWLEDVEGSSEKLPENSFMDKALPVNTGVNTRLVVIEKEGLAVADNPMASLRKDIPAGSSIVGRISEDMAKSLPLHKGGDIRLDAAGIAHIESRHGKQLQQAGFLDVESFVNFVLQNCEAVYSTGSNRKLDLVTEGNKTLKRVIVRLEFDPRGDFYRVTTAGLIRKDFYKDENPLWERAQSNPSEKSGTVGNPRAINGQSRLSTKNDTASGTEVNEFQASLSPGEFLPPRRETRQRLRGAGVRRVADTLAKRAKNAVPTRVVDTFDELPSRLRRTFAEQANLVEGLYYDGTVWLVAENITDTGRAAEVWLHEQVGHHGVNSLFQNESEKHRTMTKFWAASGGMGNKYLAALAERYSLKPRTNIADRVLLMEEYIASVAEKMHRGTSLSSVEKSFWRRFVEAVKRLWANMVLAASDRQHTYANVEELLAASGRYVMGGTSARTARGFGNLSGGEALASVHERTQEGNGPRASLRDVLTSAKREQPGGISEAELAANPYLQSAMDKIGGDKPTLLERWESVKDNWKRRVEQGIFDQFAAINDVSQEGYRQARMTTSLGTQLQTMLHYGAPVWKEGAMSVQGKSLTDVFAPVADELDRYLRWMVGVRADRLKTEGRENLFAQEEIEALKGLNQGRTSADMSRQAVYKSVFNNFAEFKKRVLDFADEAGLIDPESRAVWENADYIPFYRLQERMDGMAAKGPSAGRGLTGQNSGVKRLKGGLENIGDPLENIMRNFAHMIDAAQKNRASVTILRDMERSGVAKRLSPVALHEELQVQGRALAEAMRQEFGTDSVMGPLSSKEKKAVLSLFTPSGGFVSCSVNGKPLWFSVSDPLLHRAMTNMRQTELRNNPIWKLFRKARSLLTTSVTAMPDFIVRNFLRDTLSVWAQEHRSGFTPLLDSVKQIKNVYSVDEDMRQLMASGAAFTGGGHRLGNNSEELSKELNKMLQRYKMDKTEFASSLLNTPKKLGNFLGKAWEQYERAGSAAENSSRLAVYKKLRAQGYSHAEASFAAKDLMDFSMRGEWEVVRTLTEVVPFLGARLAGLHRLGRGATENPRAFAFKGLTIAAASVALYALNLLANSDEWDKLEDWDRDSYFHFWIGGKHFRLPKPFEVGFVFGTVPERMVEQLMTDKPGRVLFSRIAHGALEQLSFNPVPQALTPVLEQAANRNFFRDRPIVSLGLDRKLPVDQYRETTSLTARHFATLMDTILSPMAGKTGLDTLRSPVRIEHLVEGYLGGLGSSLLGLSDVVLRSVTNAPSAPERRLEEMPFIRAFYRGSSENAERSRYETVLYDALSTADKLHSLIKGKQESGEEVQSIHSQLSDKELQVLAVRNGLRSTATALSNLNKQAERVRASTALTPSQKRAKLDKIQERKNGLAQRMVRRLEGKAA